MSQLCFYLDHIKSVDVFLTLHRPSFGDPGPKMREQIRAHGTNRTQLAGILPIPAREIAHQLRVDVETEGQDLDAVSGAEPLQQKSAHRPGVHAPPGLLNGKPFDAPHVVAAVAVGALLGRHAGVPVATALALARQALRLDVEPVLALLVAEITQM